VNNNNKTSLAVFAIVVTLGMLATSASIQRAMAANITNTTLPLNLGNPYYIEYDKTTGQKAVIVNGTTNATEITFSGHGTAKDVNFTDNGRGLIIPRDTKGSAVLLQGNINLRTTNVDKASLNFKELGHVDTNGMVKANGAAFFDVNATGKLAYLSNTISIYRSGRQIWEWQGLSLGMEQVTSQ
jgi:hypothetical protein